MAATKTEGKKRKRSAEEMEEERAGKRKRVAAKVECHLEGARKLLLELERNNVPVERVVRLQLAQVPVRDALAVHALLELQDGQQWRVWLKMAPDSEVQAQVAIDRLKPHFGLPEVHFQSVQHHESGLWAVWSEDLSRVPDPAADPYGALLTEEHMGQTIVRRGAAGIEKAGYYLRQHPVYHEAVIAALLHTFMFRLVFGVPDSNMSNVLCLDRLEDGSPGVRVVSVDEMAVGRVGGQQGKAKDFLGYLFGKVPRKDIMEHCRRYVLERTAALRVLLDDWIQLLTPDSPESQTLPWSFCGALQYELEEGHCLQRALALRERLVE